MNWEKERDALIAQTVEFVQSVTGRKPDFATAPVLPALPIKVIPSADVVADQSETIDTLARSEVVDQLQPAVFTPAVLSSGSTMDAEIENQPDVSLQEQEYELPKIDIRTDVRNRVTAFQAHQNRFQHDRDVYFRSVLAKARAGAEAKDNRGSQTDGNDR